MPVRKDTYLQAYITQIKDSTNSAGAKATSSYTRHK